MRRRRKKVIIIMMSLPITSSLPIYLNGLLRSVSAFMVVSQMASTQWATFTSSYISLDNTESMDWLVVVMVVVVK